MNGAEVRLRDILIHARRVKSFCSDVSRAEFLDDERTHQAVLYSLLVIGEAANRLPDEIRVGVTGVPWEQVVGFRNVAVHEYFRVNLTRVWQIAQTEIPDLIRAIEDYKNE